MRVDVADLAAFGQGLQRQAHRAFAAFARWGHHIVTVGGRGEACDLCVNLRAACLGVLKGFEHEHRAAACDHKTVAVGVESAGGFLWRVVILGRHRAHRVE